MSDKKMKFITLNSGHIMPVIGYTASVYRNEDYIGQCLKSLLPKYGLQRSDIFITSKLGPKDQGRGKCRTAFLQSLQRLQCDYLDLYLIHWPGAQGMQPQDPRHRDLRVGSWNDMVELQKEDNHDHTFTCWSSKWTVGLKLLLGPVYIHIHDSKLRLCTRYIHGGTILILFDFLLLKIEHHPHLIQKSLIEFCKEKEIHFQAYSSLGTSNVTENKLLNNPVVKSIADTKSKSTAQILLKWAVQQDIGVLPKSTNPQHIHENIDIFTWTLTEDEIKTLNSLEHGYHYCWNPEHVT
ncbi:hypothetical protein KUTeg_008493 [Tegillarca granosa]|uniref:NADP-dependent oxidoreductase domain-containing protein n=1 Tax=Tegillarca granosa TaxID=220873 RepID=A0ABQ9FDJ9_TEGGR|nr:hypothetical protein KUTeg_008493 [Tegillarca granosa]